MVILEIVTDGMEYSEFRDDPVFPAMHRRGPDYFNNATIPGLLGCVDNTLICDPDLNQCWNWPETSADLNPTLSDPVRDEVDGVLTNADLARVLLSSAIFNSFEGMMRTHKDNLEAKSHCDDIYCLGLPREQWKTEARQMFETSLAQMQHRVLDIVRGVDDGLQNQKLSWSLEIPPNLRGICHMGKFKSVGWRNVSVWGLVGLLSLSGAIALASVKTEDDELWLIVGARLLNQALRWGMHLLRAIPWASTSKWMLHVVSSFLERLVRDVRQLGWPW